MLISIKLAEIEFVSLLGLDWLPWYLSIESILLKFHEETLQSSSWLSTHIIEGKHKIWETIPKSEEIAQFYPRFL